MPQANRKHRRHRQRQQIRRTVNRQETTVQRVHQYHKHEKEQELNGIPHPQLSQSIQIRSLPPRQQCILLCGDLINQAFLRQSSFSQIDRYASPARQTAMMGLIARFVERGLQLVEQGVDLAALARLPVLRRLQRMGEEISEQALEEFQVLASQLETELGQLERTEAHAG